MTSSFDGFDSERAKKDLSEILDKLHKNTDLALLRKYKKIFKKEISLFSRSWVAAWLFMNYEQKGNPSKSYNGVSEKDRNNEDFKQLFFSIGKNRRLHSKELASFISLKTSAAKEDIGAIRVLDNYSFVQIKSEKAEEVIEKLNGEMLRGRTLGVNYAKNKE